MDRKEYIELARKVMKWVVELNKNTYMLTRMQQLQEISAGTLEYQDIKKAVLFVLVTMHEIEPIEAIDCIEKIILDLNVLKPENMKLRFRLKIDDWANKQSGFT